MRIFVLLGILIPMSIWGQRSEVDARRMSHMNQYLTSFSDSGTLNERFYRKITKLIKSTGGETDLAALKKLFARTHFHLLKHYSVQASFGELAASGKYNCLSGTALFALLLDYCQFNFSIIETNYHVFILVHFTDKSVIVEITDPLFGLIDDQEMVTARMEEYKQNNLLPSQAENRYRFNFELFDEVTLDQLRSLLLFNSAVEAYNKRELAAAFEHLQAASENYSSPRIEEFTQILLLTIAESKLGQDEKRGLVKSIRDLQLKYQQ